MRPETFIDPNSGHAYGIWKTRKPLSRIDVTVKGRPHEVLAERSEEINERSLGWMFRLLAFGKYEGFSSKAYRNYIDLNALPSGVFYALLGIRENVRHSRHFSLYTPLGLKYGKPRLVTVE